MNINVYYDSYNERHISRVDWMSNKIWCVFYPFGDIEGNNFLDMNFTVVNFNKNVEWFVI